MIGTSHRFKDIIGVIFEEVLHIETLRGAVIPPLYFLGKLRVTRHTAVIAFR